MTVSSNSVLSLDPSFEIGAGWASGTSGGNNGVADSTRHHIVTTKVANDLQIFKDLSQITANLDGSGAGKNWGHPHYSGRLRVVWLGTATISGTGADVERGCRKWWLSPGVLRPRARSVPGRGLLPGVAIGACHHARPHAPPTAALFTAPPSAVPAARASRRAGVCWWRGRRSRAPAAGSHRRGRARNR